MRVNIVIELKVKDDSFDLSESLYHDLRNVVLDSLYKKDKFGEVKNINVTNVYLGNVLFKTAPKRKEKV